jgi:glycosyltransferase involved in cell wall biosynthesis
MWHGWNSKLANRISKNHIYKYLFSYVFGKADVFTVLASDFMNQLKSLGISNPIYLETTLFEDHLISNIDLKARKKILSKQFNILFLARIEKEKGIYVVIDAYKMLKPKFPSITLTIAGDGHEMNNVEKYINKLEIKDISCVGYITDQTKIEIFKKADIFVLPTYHGEGMPISLLEAMAFGLPVLTRQVGGIKDFFEDGKMGYITESKKPATFAEFIEILITDSNKTKRIGEYNHNFALRNFKATNVAKRIDKLYKKIILNSHNQ